MVVLENIRSAHNVGTILRTADGAGVREVILTGYTPAPRDRFGRMRADIKKAALGAEESVPWRHIEDRDACIAYLHDQHAHIVAVEQTENAVPYTTYNNKGVVALVFGNEIDGVSEAFLNAAETHIHIPMVGKKESLNVAIAAGIVLFRLRD